MNGDTADGAMGRKSKDMYGITTYSFETVVGPALFHLAMQFSEMFRLLVFFFFCRSKNSKPSCRSNPVIMTVIFRALLFEEELRRRQGVGAGERKERGSSRSRQTELQQRRQPLCPQGLDSCRLLRVNCRLAGGGRVVLCGGLCGGPRVAASGTAAARSDPGQR
jgi:hypothetical protein